MMVAYGRDHDNVVIVPHIGGEAINLLHYDGHVGSRSKRAEPSMFRLRWASGGGDVVNSPYVRDFAQADPDGLWRACLRTYPHSGSYAGNQ